ncbi:hypothetical protein PENTCL1PPCAC_30841, partial [Pristionchus entomophagus]
SPVTQATCTLTGVRRCVPVGGAYIEIPWIKATTIQVNGCDVRALQCDGSDVPPLFGGPRSRTILQYWKFGEIDYHDVYDDGTGVATLQLLCDATATFWIFQGPQIVQAACYYTNTDCQACAGSQIARTESGAAFTPDVVVGPPCPFYLYDAHADLRHHDLE